MKKYLQITVVLGAFFLLVFVKNSRGSDDDSQAIGKLQVSPTLEAKKTPTATSNFSPTALPTKNSVPLSATPTQIAGKYRDGSYDGTVEDAFYGNLQVRAVIKGGRLTDVVPLMYPNDNRTSISINTQALALLKDEAITAQSSEVDIISGASDSSPAFSRSLAQALKKAQN